MFLRPNHVPVFKYSPQFVVVLLRQCCNLLLVETLKDPLSFRVSDQTIPKQQHVVQVSGTTWPFGQNPVHPFNVHIPLKRHNQNEQASAAKIRMLS